ncbi:response regulator transcription factor [Ohessyouella blattaphilus]|uniref:helix-turn-helix transcriptional regulator n=1 Tax=Ohessyouella blattaphilus TaxID=2949333 RepID=UPI003EBE183A
MKCHRHFFIGQEYFKCNYLVQAETIFRELIKKLEVNQEQEQRSGILGECYLMQGIICLRKEEFFDLEVVEKAVSYLPRGSILTNQHSYLLNENGVFFLPENETKTVTEMIAFIYRYTEIFIRVSNGCLAGFDYLYEAEANLYGCQFERADFCANQALFRAAMEGQHDIVINAYDILINLAFYQGNAQAVYDNIQSLTDYCEKYDTCKFNDLRDGLCAIYNFYLGRPEEAADWIKAADLLHHYEDKSPYIGRDLFVCAVFAYTQENLPLFSTLTDEIDNLLATRNIWKLKVSGNVLQALSLHRQNQPEKAIEAFKVAYKMVYKERLFYPLLTFGEYLLPLLRGIREAKDPQIDSAWLNDLEERTRSYLRSLRTLKAAYVKIEGVPSSAIERLTLREKRVLKLLAQGFSRSEIALNLGISVSGVQKFLGNIYTKLGAKNGADAVSIAHNSKLI